MRNNRKNILGFTLIELMITIAIVGILAAIALPAYQNYTRRARFSEMVLAMAPYKQAVAECAQDLGTTTGCSGGTYGIGANVAVAEGNITSITTLNGTITIVPVAANGILATDTIINNPSLSTSGRVQWTISGGALTSGYVKQ